MKWQLSSHAIRTRAENAKPAAGVSMKVLVATDAWKPQVNGVVRTLNSLHRAAGKLGVTIDFLSPEGFPSFPVPTYPGLRLAIPSRRRVARRIEESNPDAVHIATEGPIGFAVRAYCRRRGRPFTTSYTTRFPEYISARSPIPQSWIYATLRWFHSAAAVTMVATPSLLNELSGRGFSNLGMWTRGVDVDLFRSDRAIHLDFPRPIFVTLGRVAVEKNIDAFLALDLPGTKVVIGSGPQEAQLKRNFPDAKFLGHMDNGVLASHLAAADVFVFPSRTDTFGIVQLEALASGLPIAAFPVTGPKDVVANNPIGVLNEDLRVACLEALKLPRDSCRAFALNYSWENSARQFIGHARKIAGGGDSGRQPAAALPETVHGWDHSSARRSRMSTLSATDLDTRTITKAYARWAPVYDLVFGAVFERGRHAAIAAAERVGGRILEVGVGTGISLPQYSRSSRLCGVDISEPMLKKAHERVDEFGLSNVEGLWVMDAENLSFPDASFDVVVAQYVITTVPNPEATLDEFARVLKPGGEIVLVSRVGAEAGLRRSLEHWFQPAARKLGWRTEFSFARYAEWASRTAGMRLVERRAMPPFGHFSLIRFAREGAVDHGRDDANTFRAAG
jgi:glycosyltransferase involved in cell wall biosynthesis/ubiquinone/menaquinone biosynthesis C-methylase UbiE